MFRFLLIVLIVLVSYGEVYSQVWVSPEAYQEAYRDYVREQVRAENRAKRKAIREMRKRLRGEREEEREEEEREEDRGGENRRVNHYVSIVLQETLVWCWVATAKMLVESNTKRDAPPQCAMLEGQYGYPCCSAPHLCARAGHISEMIALIQRYGGRASRVAFPSSPEDFYRILKKGPLGIHTNEGGGHFVVAAGIEENDGEWLVKIYDPFKGVRNIPYRELRRLMDVLLVLD